MRVDRKLISNSAKRMMDKSMHIPTGFSDLDDATLGLHEGEVMIIAARPSMGKTALSINICLNISVNEPVLYVSAEMTAQQLIERMIVSIAKVDSMKVRNNTLEASERGQLRWACEQLEERNIHICDDSLITVEKIREEWEFAGRPRVVIVDYIQLMTSTNLSNSRNEDLGNIARELHGFAKDNKIALVVLCQLNRKLEDRPNKTPRMSDLRDSGAIEQVTDSVLFIHRQDYYKKDPLDEENGQALLIMGKNRNGPTCVLKAVFIKEYASFDDLSEEDKQKFGGFCDE